VIMSLNEGRSGLMRSGEITRRRCARGRSRRRRRPRRRSSAGTRASGSGRTCRP
jgi:hypothetical protein